MPHPSPRERALTPQAAAPPALLVQKLRQSTQTVEQVVQRRAIVDRARYEKSHADSNANYSSVGPMTPTTFIPTVFSFASVVSKRHRSSRASARYSAS